MSSPLRVISEGTRLYRRLLRLHRELPPPLRSLGDAHLRHEWREVFVVAPRKQELKPEQVASFFSSWRRYAEGLEGGDLGGMAADLAALNDDQLKKMYQLEEEAKGKE